MKGWARDGGIKGDHEKYGYVLSLNHNGSEEYGGPLFWAHYSYLGLDPRQSEGHLCGLLAVKITIRLSLTGNGVSGILTNIPAMAKIAGV